MPIRTGGRMGNYEERYNQWDMRRLVERKPEGLGEKRFIFASEVVGGPWSGERFARYLGK